MLTAQTMARQAEHIYDDMNRDGTSDHISPSVGKRSDVKSICGDRVEMERPSCADVGSLVRSQSRATAWMSCAKCTAWLVKAETATNGALMLTAGHCGKRIEDTFN